jgi:hypothetical protein
MYKKGRMVPPSLKQKNIRAEERSAAEALYNNARKIYDEIVKDSAK